MSKAFFDEHRQRFTVATSIAGIDANIVAGCPSHCCGPRQQRNKDLIVGVLKMVTSSTPSDAAIEYPQSLKRGCTKSNLFADHTGSAKAADLRGSKRKRIEFLAFLVSCARHKNPVASSRF